jgi:hypothetical protein
MFRGKKPNHDRAMTPAGALSGHLDDWEDIAVDFVDGRLDPGTKSLVEQHLSVCPDCSARLQRQQTTLAWLREAPQVDAPAFLEHRVIDEVVWGTDTEKDRQVYEVEPRPSRVRSWRPSMRAWVPATVVILAVLVGVVGFAVLRSGGGREQVAVTTTAAVVAGAVATDASAPMLETTAAGQGSSTGTSETVALEGPPTTTASASTVAPGTEPDTNIAKAFGPSVQDRDGMIGSVTSATPDSPAFFLFQSSPPAATTDEGVAQPQSVETTIPSPITGEGETLVTREQADAVAVQITAQTDLEPLDQSLTFDRPTFAAYVPLDDVAQLVDLLRSIGSSLDLTVCVTREPGPAVEEWLPGLLEGKSRLVELSASRTPSPAVSSWTFTTSTLRPPSEAAGDAPAEPAPDEAVTRVLVVILVNVLP